jgi:hypothetical protein
MHLIQLRSRTTPFRGPPEQFLKLSSGATGRRGKVSCATDGASERPLISGIAEEFSVLVGAFFVWSLCFWASKKKGTRQEAKC